MALIVALAAAAAFLLLRPQPLWSGSLESLSLDFARRAEARPRAAPGRRRSDVRHLVAVSAPTEQAALEMAERASAALREAVGRGWLEGFDSPASYLPSEATQRARQAALPAAQTLRETSEARAQRPAVPGRRLRAFVRDVAGARRATSRTLQPPGTSLGLRLDALLVQRAAGWIGMPRCAASKMPERLPPRCRRARSSSTSRWSSTKCIEAIFAKPWSIPAGRRGDRGAAFHEPALAAPCARRSRAACRGSARNIRAAGAPPA